MLPSSFQTKSEKAAKQLHLGPPRTPVPPARVRNRLHGQGGGTRRWDTQPKGYPSKGERVWQLPPRKENSDSKTRRIAAHAIPSLLRMESPLPPFPTQGGGQLMLGRLLWSLNAVGGITHLPPSFLCFTVSLSLIYTYTLHLVRERLRGWVRGREGEGGGVGWVSMVRKCPCSCFIFPLGRAHDPTTTQSRRSVPVGERPGRGSNTRSSCKARRGNRTLFRTRQPRSPPLCFPGGGISW